MAWMAEQVGKDRRTGGRSDGRSNGRLKLGRAQKEGTRTDGGWEHDGMEGRKRESDGEGADVDRPPTSLSVVPLLSGVGPTTRRAAAIAASPLSLSLSLSLPVSRGQEEGRAACYTHKYRCSHWPRPSVLPSVRARPPAKLAANE